MKKNQKNLQNNMNIEEFQINKKSKNNSSIKKSLNSLDSNNISNTSSQFYSKKNNSIIKNLTNLSRAKLNSAKIILILKN